MTLPHRIASVAILSALALSGCGSSPTAPILDSSDLAGSGGAPRAVQRLAPDEPAVVPVPIEGSATIRGRDGGTLTVGAFTLEIPAGAFHGNATVTLRQADPQLMQVEIDVQPAAKNDFARSATLTADLSGWSRTQIRRASMWSLDPAIGTFVPVPGTSVDLARGRVRAPFTKLATSKVKSS